MVAVPLGSLLIGTELHIVGNITRTGTLNYRGSTQIKVCVSKWIYSKVLPGIF